MAGHLTSDQGQETGHDRAAPASPTHMEYAPPNPAQWRAAMGYFPTGVLIVTTWDAGVPVGSTISAFCSVSLEPPMLLICLAHENPIRAPLEDSGVFGVNFLHEDGGPIARRFAREPLTDRFTEHPYRAGARGAPQLEAAPLFIDCRVESKHLAGDHLIIVGRGLRIDQVSGVTPLLYHQGRFPKLISST